ncbi:MAG: DUF2974 domain-containing protein, partial [Treponemataceae bacterium]|nr:DUF2974 domain-containing protein [Treponemataceae bacterium]
INAQTVELLDLAGNTERFKNCKFCNFRDDLNYETEKQFSAYTAFLDDGSIFVAYRGTHEEIVGWKEDLNMAFETPVPAQVESVKYLEEIGKKFKKPIRIGGHSKGGNLALYAAAFCDKKTKNKIERVYNNDGQGFEKSVLERSEFYEIVPKIQTVIPQSSMVGILLDHKGTVKIIESCNSNVMQHDAFSWQVEKTGFKLVKERSKESLFFDKTMRKWLDAMDKKRRKDVIDTLYEMFSISGAKTLTEFKESWFKASPKVLLFLHSRSEQTKKDLIKTLRIFFKSARDEIIHKNSETEKGQM